MLKKKVLPIATSNHFRDSLTNRTEFTLSLYRDERIIPFKESWDVLKDEFNSMISKGVEYISDHHINCWITMAHELGYAFYYQHEFINGKFVVNFFAVEEVNKSYKLNA